MFFIRIFYPKAIDKLFYLREFMKYFLHMNERSQDKRHEEKLLEKKTFKLF